MQWLYVVYRWILALFFTRCAIQCLASNGRYYFIYLTMWSLTVYSAYLLWSAASTTTTFVQVHIWPVLCKDRERKQADSDHFATYGCCCFAANGDTNAATWYMKIQWLLFYIGIESPLLVAVLFWTLLYPDCRGTDFCENRKNYILHLMNGLTALLDVWITGIPFHLYHVIYSMMLGGTYVAFSALYFAMTCNRGESENYIYPVLDYEESPNPIAIVVMLPVALVLLPLLHLFLLTNYLARRGLLYLIKKKLCNKIISSKAIGIII